MSYSQILRFKGKWRSYQKRILDNLSHHLSDDKLHVVAAPGAGKTTLGIEVIARINRPAMILCPTNTIKNQWKERICSAFLEEKDYGIVSTDIRKPSFLTVITYQSLLAAFCEGTSSKNMEDYQDDVNYEYNNEEEMIDDKSISSSRRFSKNKADEIIKVLRDAKLSLLCFDEAHHLRNEWWKALIYLIEELKPEQTVSLTATPPYDVDLNEWQRYEELCGPIDETISIPELVKNGDLCPHQDFIYFSLLNENETELIKKHNRAVVEFFKKLTSDVELLDYLSKMSFLTASDDNIEKIYDDPKFYVSVAALLNSKGYTVPVDFVLLFNERNNNLPKFNQESAAAFLDGFLISHREEFAGIGCKIDEYAGMARHAGLIYNKRVVINNNPKIQKQIAGSAGKIDAVKKIAGVEIQNLGSNLRMVVLADYIKSDDADNSHPGVVPIWRALNNAYGNVASLGILCGTLIVIPHRVEQYLYSMMEDNGLSKDDISVNKYKEDEIYLKIIPRDSARQKIVSIITEMFNRGFLTILVGTQALLGEGWDAPVINSLVLSSTVSSYMLSNQMRGRAIRKDPNNPDKISNIWHLASVMVPQKSDLINDFFQNDEISLPHLDNIEGLYDLSRLEKRFDGFEAPSYYDNHEVTSGIDRIITHNFIEKIYISGEKAFSDLNDLSVSIAANRQQTKNWWNDALYSGYNKSIMTVQSGIESPKKTTKFFVYSGYKKEILSVIGSFSGILLFLLSLRIMILPVLAVWSLLLILTICYIFLKYLKTGSVASVLKQIAIVHLETLWQMDLINTSLKKVGIHVSDKDSVFLSFKNLTTEENNLLIKALQEFLNPIENPRYLLIKKGKRIESVCQTDYFSIPSVISTNKKNVKIFKKLWKKYIGECEIVYTRNLEGRNLLLKARTSAFSSSKRDMTKKVSKWQ